MAQAMILKGCRAYLERSGLMPTYRLPLPRFAGSQLTVHNEPLSAPLPDPALMYHINGDPSPDRGVTQVWPPTQENPA